jgi:peroxiredoxin
MLKAATDIWFREIDMKRLLAGLVLAGLATLPAHAALKNGAKAPDFTTQASMGGKVFEFKMKDALKKGPVVLYFYPAAFTKGCTIEAHEFADATDDFAKMHATVIGVSRDNIDTLNKFSVSECRSKFPVAADGDGKISQAYDVKTLSFGGRDLSDRTSYVIAPNGEVLLEYTAMAPDQHVANTMAAVKSWADTHGKH